MLFDNMKDNEWFTLYQNYTEIVKYFKGLASDYPSIAKYSSIGTTYQSRAIPVLKVTGTAKGTKQKVLVVGGLQAREWIAPSTVAYLAQEFVTLYGTDDASDPSSYTSLLNKFELHFIPVANPDGYVYSWGTSRLWRKNRRPNSDGSYGVDLNKNWNATQWKSWCTAAPSSDTYCGTAPFSEKETSSIQTYVNKNGPFLVAVEYSSYGQQVLRPLSSSTAPPPNDATLKALANSWADVMTVDGEVSYSSLPSSSVYSVPGNARDWLFSYANIPYSFTVKLRDTGSYGFMLPVCQILPTCIENFNGFTDFLQSVPA